MEKRNNSFIRLNSLHYSLFAVLVIFLFTVFAYSNTFRSGFVFDDRESIVDNEVLKNPLAINQIYRSNPSRFIPYYSFSLNYAIAGFQPLSFHITNFLIHFLCTVVVFLFIKQISKNFLIAFGVSLLFAVHPIQTQTVSYVTQRMTSLVTLFYLLSLYLFLLFRQKKKIFFYFLSLVIGACAFLTKENSYTLPLSMLLCDLLFYPAKKKKILYKILSVLPFFIIIFFFYVSSSVVRQNTVFKFEKIGEYVNAIPKPVTEIKTSRYEYFLTQTNVLGKYLQLMVYPVNQNLDYDYPVVRNFRDGYTFLYIFSHLFFIAIAVFFWKKSPIVTFSILFFYLTNSVESSVIPLDDLINEHRAYLPSIGIFLLFSYLLYQMLKKNIFTKTVYIICILVIASIFSVITYNRNFVWQSEESIWTDVITKSPNKPRAHYNLGVAYLEKGKQEEALKQFEKSIELDPKYIRGYNNIGVIYERKNDLKKAMEMYDKALVVEPNNVYILVNKAVLTVDQEDLDKGYELLQKAISLDGKNPYAHSGLGVIYSARGEMDKAEASFWKALEEKPDYAVAYFNLGVLYREKGDKDKAMEYLKKALFYDPDYTKAQKELDNMFLQR